MQLTVAYLIWATGDTMANIIFKNTDDSTLTLNSGDTIHINMNWIIKP